MTRSAGAARSPAKSSHRGPSSPPRRRARGRRLPPAPALRVAAGGATGQRLPWPRLADDGTPLGVDVAVRAGEIRKLVCKKLLGYARGAGFSDPEDAVQEVMLAVCHKNRQPCAFDPRRAALGKYTFTVGRAWFINLRDKRERRLDTIDGGRGRTDIDVLEIASEEPDEPLEELSLWQAALLGRSAPPTR